MNNNQLEDVIKEVRKKPVFSNYLKDAEVKIRLSIEVYQMREQKGLSQTQLAKHVKTTQKVISKIENAEQNVGIELLNRLASFLEFDVKNWSNIFNFYPNTFTITIKHELPTSKDNVAAISKTGQYSTLSANLMV